MKKPFLAALGVTAACAACCAIPIALPAILAFAGVTSASLGAGPAAAAVGAAAATLLAVALWQRVRKKAAATRASGCETSCNVKGCS